MYRKLSCLALAVALAALSLACKRDADVGAVVDELNSFTQEIVKRVEGAADPSAGVDDAQTYFDSRKSEMEGKLKSIKDVRGFQVSQETQKKMTEQLTEDVMSVSKLQIKYMSQSMRDPAFRTKLTKLITDYTNLLKSVGEG